MKAETRNIAAMCVGCASLFFGYSTAQSFVVPLFGSLGSVSLGIVYGMLAFGNTLAPSALRTVGGTRNALVLSALGYVCVWRGRGRRAAPSDGSRAD